MIDVSKAILKVRKPPALPNWARHNFPSVGPTAQALANFALGGPRITLQKIYKIIGWMIIDQLPMKMVRAMIDEIDDPIVRKAGHEIATAFEKYNLERNFDGIQALHNWGTVYPLARDVFVPVKPAFIIIEAGKLKPVFLLGWSKLDLTDYQIRLMLTIIHDAVLTRQEFMDCDAEVLCFPRVAPEVRKVQSFKVSECDLMKPREVSSQIEVYGSALDIVPDLIRTIAERRAKR